MSKPPHFALDFQDGIYSRNGVEAIRMVEETMNDDGIRALRNHSVGKSNRTRIIALGDSFTFGRGVSDNETFSYLLEQSLNQDELELGVEVLNLGIPGYNTRMEVQRLIRTGLKYHPDLIILFYVDNDIMDYEVSTNLVDYGIEFLQANLNYSRDQAFSTLNRRMQMAYWNRVQNRELTEVWQDINEALELLEDVSQREGFQVILVAFPSPRKHREYLGEAAQESGWSLLELQTEIGYEWSDVWMIHVADNHPTVYAHEQIALFLEDYLIRNGYVSVSG